MIITRDTIERIISDIKELKKDKNNNIYYFHHDKNILKGYALIIGNKDTLYEYGYYLFENRFFHIIILLNHLFSLI